MPEEPQQPENVDAAPEVTPDETATDAGTDSDDALPDWARKKIEKANREARNLRDRLKAVEPKVAQFDALTESAKSDLERAQEAAQVASDRATSYRNRAVSAEARAAARDFADPTDAVALLGDLGRYVDDDGDIDSSKLSDDLKSMLESKPYLARVQEPPGMKPNPAQSRGYSQPPTKAQEIQEAQSRGDRKKASILRADQLLMND